MPYIFPKRKLRDEDVLDPLELNADFIPAAELYSGGINAHNVKQSLNHEFNRNNSDETAYYKYAFNAQDCDPKLGEATSGSVAHTLPALSTVTNAHQVRNDNSWDVVDSTNLAVSSFSTGISTLWITAHVQYFWMGWTMEGLTRALGSDLPLGAQRTHHHWAFRNPGNCRLQFAIRLDGRIVESTITGRRYLFDHSVEPVRSKYQRGGGIGFSSSVEKGDKKFPGPHGTWTEQATALGPPALPVRLGCYQQVQPGTHSVEVVVRRLPRLDGDDDLSDLEGDTVDEDVVLVGTRKLFVMELKRHPTATTTLSSIDVPAFDSEDVLSETELQTNRRDKIRTAYNTVKKGALARGALNHYHLKSPVIDANQVARQDLAAALTARYPGHGNWGSTTHTGKFAGTASGIGFYTLETSSGKFQVGPSSGSHFDLSEPSIFIVTGNVQVNSLKNATSTGGFDPGSSTDNEGIATMANFAAIAIGFTSTAGKNVIPGNCIAYVDSFNAMTYIDEPTAADNPPTTFGNHDKSFDEDVNIPVFHVFTSSTLSAYTGGPNVSTFQLYGSTCSPVGSGMGFTNQVRLRYMRGNLAVIQLYV